MAEGGFTAALLGVLALVLANLPFFTRRVFFVIGRGDKGFAWRLAEVLALYVVVLLVARFLESRGGPVYPQNWEFYAITLALFLVFAYPGFVYRYLWRREAADDSDDE